MFYLALTFSCLWITLFVYLFTIDRQVKDLAKRLQARSSNDEDILKP